jgi:hypothetical protein
MKTPQRNAAIAQALASETDGLRKDFASHVAALAEATETAPRWSWNDAALLGAFITMLGVCTAGWWMFGELEPGGVEWLAPIVRVLESQPWLFIGVAGVVLVQVLTFRRRALT